MIYVSNKRSRNILVFLSNNTRNELAAELVFTGPGFEAGVLSEDFSGTAIFFFILYFFDILP